MFAPEPGVRLDIGCSATNNFFARSIGELLNGIMFSQPPYQRFWDNPRGVFVREHGALRFMTAGLVKLLRRAQLRCFSCWRGVRVRWRRPRGIHVAQRN